MIICVTGTNCRQRFWTCFVLTSQKTERLFTIRYTRLVRFMVGASYQDRRCKCRPRVWAERDGCPAGCGEWNLPSSALMPLPGHMLFVFVCLWLVPSTSKRTGEIRQVQWRQSVVLFLALCNRPSGSRKNCIIISQSHDVLFQVRIE